LNIKIKAASLPDMQNIGRPKKMRWLILSSLLIFG